MAKWHIQVTSEYERRTDHVQVASTGYIPATCNAKQRLQLMAGCSKTRLIR